MCNDALVYLAQQAFQDVGEQEGPAIVNGLSSMGPIGDSFLTETNTQSNPETSNQDINIYNGTILTMAGGTFSPTESMATQGDTILSVGSSSDVKQAVVSSKLPFTERTLSPGQVMLPGFVEPHLHLMLSAMIASPSPIRDLTYSESLKTRADVITCIQSSPNYDPDGNSGNSKWIIGFGYDPSLIEDHLEFHINGSPDTDPDGNSTTSAPTTLSTSSTNPAIWPT